MLRKDIEAPFSTSSNEIVCYINGQVQTCDGLMGILDIKDCYLNRRDNYVDNY